MMTLSGRLITKYEGTPTLDDIAVGLSRMPRFAGQTLYPWSVADHSLVTMRMAESHPFNTREWPRLPLHCLLHDAHEAMTGDIPTSFKTQDIKSLQRVLDVRLYMDLNLTTPNDQERAKIAMYDMEALLAEAKVLAPKATYDRIAFEIGMAASEWGEKIVQTVFDLGDPEDTLEEYRYFLTAEVARWKGK
jgi:5'-deoxynucleotidase YfbR-like HD superfamily hydrolase